jgi:beta-lactam-binding protein with PASTA domain
MWRHVPSTLDPDPDPVPPAAVPGPPQPGAPARPVSVAPDLVGLRSTDARRVAREWGLLVEIEERPTAPELRGQVLEQRPSPGQSMEPGANLVLTVGSRPYVTVPDIRGRDEDEATAMLRELGLEAVRRATRRTDRVPEGSILRTRPRAGAEVVYGSSVSYVLAAGARPSRGDHADHRHRRVGRLPDGSFLSLPEDRPRGRR